MQCVNTSLFSRGHLASFPLPGKQSEKTRGELEVSIHTTTTLFLSSHTADTFFLSPHLILLQLLLLPFFLFISSVLFRHFLLISPIAISLYICMSIALSDCLIICSSFLSFLFLSLIPLSFFSLTSFFIFRSHMITFLLQ